LITAVREIDSGAKAQAGANSGIARGREGFCEKPSARRIEHLHAFQQKLHGNISPAEQALADQ